MRDSARLVPDISVFEVNFQLDQKAYFWSVMT